MLEDLEDLVVIEEFPAYSVTVDGMVFSSKSNKWLSRRIYEGGYWGVNLRDVNGKNVYRNCHTLVAKAYLKSSWKEGLIVNHKDLDKSNCHVSNLEWVTYKENTQHYVQNSPEQASDARRDISIEDIKLVCELVQAGYTTPEIHKKTDVPKGKICKLRTGKLYSWISKEYKLQPEPFDYITEETATEICELLERGYGCKEICDRYPYNHKIKKSSVNNIKYRKTFEHISSKYTWWIGKYLSKAEWRAGKTLND